MWYAKLKAVRVEADINSITPDQLVLVQLIVMNWDMKLQTELLKLRNPSKKDILTMVKAFKAVQSSRNRLLVITGLTR